MKKFIGKNPTILEIGIQYGGSLDMWNYYFDNNCKIYGVDIDQKCKELEKHFNNVTIYIGDQENKDFWKQLKDIKFDIIIDDGGHTMNQQINTYESLINQLNEGGVYICEDVHTSYELRKYGGGYKNPNTFVEYAKNFIDYLHTDYISVPRGRNQEFRDNIFSVHFYECVVVLEKRKKPKSKSIIVLPPQSFNKGDMFPHQPGAKISKAWIEYEMC